MRLRASAFLRKSSNGRRAVSKTVNVGSIPAFRANVTKIASNLTLAKAEARLLTRNKVERKSYFM